MNDKGISGLFHDAVDILDQSDSRLLIVDFGEFEIVKQQLMVQIEEHFDHVKNNKKDYYLLLKIISKDEFSHIQNLKKEYFKLLERLTRREIEVLQLAIDNYQNQEIADKLHISIETVRSHRKNILTKSNFSNIHELRLFFYKVIHTINY